MKVFLDSVRLHGRHGVMPQERTVGNDFMFDIEVSYTTDSGNLPADDISTTISYADLFGIVREENAEPRQLLETLAIAICRRIKSSYPQAERCRCRVTKLAPPIGGMTGSAGVEYEI